MNVSESALHCSLPQYSASPKLQQAQQKAQYALCAISLYTRCHTSHSACGQDHPCPTNPSHSLFIATQCGSVKQVAKFVIHLLSSICCPSPCCCCLCCCTSLISLIIRLQCLTLTLALLLLLACCCFIKLQRAPDTVNTTNQATSCACSVPSVCVPRCHGL